MSSSSSESEDETQKEYPSRLGECEVCAANDAIYTCPKCEVKTCCLKCVQIHKKELDCDGVRDRTKFIRVKNFTDRDLLSDYRLLEETARFVYAVRRDEKKRFTRIDRDLPIHLYKLKMAARKRGTALQFLTQNFTRHAVNTTRYHFKLNIIHWRVEWIFPNGEPDPVKFTDEKCAENMRLSELLDKYINSEEPLEGKKNLLFYKSVGFNGIKILLKAEKVKGSSYKFFELDPAESLAENLSGKCIVEFPIIFVVLKDHAYNFEIITPEDEFDYNPEQKQVQNDIDKSDVKEEVSKINDNNGYIENKWHRKRKTKQLLTEKIANQKKKEIEEELKQERKKRPKNLLFTTGYSSEESLELSDDEETSTKNLTPILS